MFEVSLKGKVGLITGASQGIGRACAYKLGEADIDGLVIVDLAKGEAGKETQKTLEDMNVDVKYVIGDASSEDVIKGAIDLAVKSWGHLDVIVNVAGISYMTNLETTSFDQWNKVMAVNLRSVFLTMKYGSEQMKKQKSGSIVSMSSISGVTGGSTGPEYGASKAGIIALTKFAAKQLGPYNIRVNAVAPGTIGTDMIKRNYSKLTNEQRQKKLDAIYMKRLGNPAEVGKAVLFLASDMGSYVSGDTLMVTGARMS
ncbi:oxidoreductase, short chain dehydrogenase/reductase family protein [Pseudoramibacter alactolyticus ATCC 23263]|uniref:Oxidoreductase, short chain dehydrogenase/reductase family protein n=1 Tax=Pseudoramibacter alactolyticus ATCC 23263 TaxID=887929 RepID=E6MG39_9FIRM|nr:SDR family NAD(P)-dependent oxidoreductase [Pseudoramibacter alactolyticus]EFV01579.1 oxidoreductase, short chain dehydrogenase/reductase family protein [Pseudoramibacter alactolyticus ATCC 23263]